MRRRIELRETVIAPGAVVRLKAEWSTCLKDKMARWDVQSVTEGLVHVADTEDEDDMRCFPVEHLERVSGGQEAAVGHAWVDEDVTTLSDSVEDEAYEDDPFNDEGVETEIPSLFDDPIALQLEEDRDDPDYEADDVA